MKTLTLALTILTLSFSAAGPAAAAPSRFDVELISMSSTGLSRAASHFAQVGATSHAPISSGMALTLVAVFVVALRLVSLNRARALADHERDSYRGKAQMFRSLREETSDRE